jgi:hypothetical protein
VTFRAGDAKGVSLYDVLFGSTENYVNASSAELATAARVLAGE